MAYLDGDRVAYRLGKRIYVGEVRRDWPVGAPKIRVINHELKLIEMIPVESIVHHQPTLWNQAEG